MNKLKTDLQQLGGAATPAERASVINQIKNLESRIATLGRVGSRRAGRRTADVKREVGIARGKTPIGKPTKYMGAASAATLLPWLVSLMNWGK